MSKGEMTEPEMFEYLRKWVGSRKSKRWAAVELQCSDSFLGDMFHGRRAVSDKIAKALGYRKVNKYIKD